MGDDRGMLLVFAIGGVIGSFISGVVTSTYHRDSLRVQYLNPCELKLPRDQHCKLVAVPENKGE